MTWKDEYAVKVRLIDQQHKKLFDLLNKLYDAMRAQQGKEVLHNVLSELVRYTEDHFTTEERLMTQHGYPPLNSHKLEHQMLTKKVLDFEREVAGGRTSVSIEVMTFLKQWLEHHILGTDKQYSAFFAAKGVR